MFIERVKQLVASESITKQFKGPESSAVGSTYEQNPEQSNEAVNKDLKKKHLHAKDEFSRASVAKLSKGETVSMEVLFNVCTAFECDIGDILERIPFEDALKGGEHNEIEFRISAG